MSRAYSVLLAGASYGSLFATKLALAGHSARMVCLPAEVEAFNTQGARVRMPVKGHGVVEVDSRTLPGRLSAAGPGEVNPADYDLIVLAMQEPQYSSPGVRELLDAVARSRVPCMSIMNMPPPPFLARIPGVNPQSCKSAYTDFSVWDSFDSNLMTLCSPDPQAFRPPDAPINVLQVRLPTNFKAARFPSEEHTAMLRELQSSIEAARFDTGSGKIELPVKLKVHDSVFVPLAKWPMLIAGNYRCVQAEGMRSIMEAVHSDIEASRAVYNWVGKLDTTLGADTADLVPFEKYAAAAQSLVTPSSAARALALGAANIERVDRLVQIIAGEHGMHNETLDQTIRLVDGWLETNRKA